MTSLPGIAGEIEALIGLDLTVALLKERGGTEIKIPVRAKGTILAKIIGETAAEVLVRELGTGRIQLPCAHMRGEKARKMRAIAMLREGASLREVALECDLHQRTVSNYRAEIEAADDRQGKLPL